MAIDKSTFDLDSLISGTLDDLADTPEFRSWPAGMYRFKLFLERSTKMPEGATKPEPVINCKIVNLATKELVDTSPTVIPMEVGAEGNIRFQMDNEYGQGDFKKLATVIGTHFNCTNMAEVLAVTKEGVECEGVITNRPGKKRPDNTVPYYMQIVELTVC